jgi:acetyl-CoA carboxylase carboxyl transferase subunit alpha
MRITAQDLLKLGVIDRIVYEPVGGAHRDHAETFMRVRSAIASELDKLSALDGKTLRTNRRERFVRMGKQGL